MAIFGHTCRLFIEIVLLNVRVNSMCVGMYAFQATTARIIRETDIMTRLQWPNRAVLQTSPTGGVKKW